LILLLMLDVGVPRALYMAVQTLSSPDLDICRHSKFWCRSLFKMPGLLRSAWCLRSAVKPNSTLGMGGVEISMNDFGHWLL